MFPKVWTSLVVLLVASLEVHGHAAIAPVLGLGATPPQRSDVKKPSAADPCGAGVNIATALGKSTPVQAAADGTFTATCTDFNAGSDGSRQVTAQVDATAAGKNFVPVTISQNGDAAPTSVGSQPIVASLPSGTTCTGGTTGDICLVSFKTSAGFGNCVAVQQGAGGAAASAANSTATNSTATDTGAVDSAANSTATNSTTTDTGSAVDSSGSASNSTGTGVGGAAGSANHQKGKGKGKGKGKDKAKAKAVGKGQDTSTNSTTTDTGSAAAGSNSTETTGTDSSAVAGGATGSAAMNSGKGKGNGSGNGNGNGNGAGGAGADTTGAGGAAGAAQKASGQGVGAGKGNQNLANRQLAHGGTRAAKALLARLKEHGETAVHHASRGIVSWIWA